MKGIIIIVVSLIALTLILYAHLSSAQNPCSPSGGWVPTGAFECDSVTISVNSLTVNNGVTLTLRNVQMTVAGQTTVNSGGVLNILDSQGGVIQQGNLSVSGNFTLNNSLLRMDGLKDRSLRIDVNGGGSASIDRSNITNGPANGSANFLFETNADSLFSMANSYLDAITSGSPAAAIAGLHIRNTGALLENNTIKSPDSDAIVISAQDAIARNNAVISGTSGVRIDSTIPGVSIRNVIIAGNAIDSGKKNSGAGIVAIDADNVTIENNSIITRIGHGIFITATVPRQLQYSVTGNRITVNPGIVSGPAGLRIQGQTNLVNILFANSAFRNNTITVLEPFIEGLKTANTDGLEIQDMSITAPSSIDVSISGGSINLTNSTFDESDVSVTGGGSLTVKRYADIYVKGQSNTPVQGAAISIYNSTGSLVSSAVTDASGATRHALAEYTQSPAGKVLAGKYTVETIYPSGETVAIKFAVSGYARLEIVPKGADWAPSGRVIMGDANLKLNSLTINSGANLTLRNTTLEAGTTSIKPGGSLNIYDSKNTIIQSGHLFINGTYNMINATLHVNGTSNGVLSINVESAGSMYINDSIIKAGPFNGSANFFFRVQKGSAFLLENSYLEDFGGIGGGLSVEASNATIRNSTLNLSASMFQIPDTNAMNVGGPGAGGLAVNNTIQQNAIIGPACSGSCTLAGAVKIDNSSFNRIESNRITSPTNGIILVNKWEGNLIASNAVNASGSGIQITGPAPSFDLAIINNTIQSGSAGIEKSFVNGSAIINNTVHANNMGIYSQNGIDNDLIEGNSINSVFTGVSIASLGKATIAHNSINVSGFGIAGQGGIEVLTAGTANLSFNTIRVSSPISNPNSFGIDIFTASTFVSDSVVDAPDVTDIGIDVDVEATVLLTNITFNQSDIFFQPGDAAVAVRNYLDVLAQSSTGSPIPGATVTVANVSGQILSLSADSAGRIPKQTLTLFIQNRTDRIFSAPYTVSASASGFSPASTQVSLLANEFVTFTLSPV
ncbi:MAG: right-handed parallel beta-helix repeat-containing protein, partial [Candidatus Aenigmarchaeota archaeon]|nr:right-handed parallel beta-helix repeat-containing protein [Candidatus Aenigmarchaeota archaeon]